MTGRQNQGMKILHWSLGTMALVLMLVSVARAEPALAPTREEEDRILDALDVTAAELLNEQPKAEVAAPKVKAASAVKQEVHGAFENY